MTPTSNAAAGPATPTLFPSTPSPPTPDPQRTQSRGGIKLQPANRKCEGGRRSAPNDVTSYGNRMATATYTGRLPSPPEALLAQWRGSMATLSFSSGRKANNKQAPSSVPYLPRRVVDKECVLRKPFWSGFTAARESSGNFNSQRQKQRGAYNAYACDIKLRQLRADCGGKRRGLFRAGFGE